VQEDIEVVNKFAAIPEICQIPWLMHPDYAEAHSTDSQYVECRKWRFWPSCRPSLDVLLSSSISLVVEAMALSVPITQLIE